MKRLSDILQHIFLIVRKRHFSPRERLGLAWAYLAIVAKRRVRKHLPHVLDYRHQRILGYEIELDDFRADIYWIFTEIFVEENYYFKSNTPDPFILDCGGNVGLSVLYFKLLYPRATIITFEPSPDNVAILKRNLQKNGITDVEVVEAALGAGPGEITIFRQGPGTTMYEEFAGKQKQLKQEGFGENVRVPVRLLSDYVTRPVDLLKLDVEGAEGEILQNLDATGTMSQVRQIAMEYHQFSFEKNTMSAIARILEKYNFAFLGASEAHNFDESPKTNYKTFMIYAKKL